MAYNHNDILIVINSDQGFRWREAYILKERMNGCKWERFTTNYGSYAAGYDRPHYPMPAIPMSVSWDSKGPIVVECYDHADNVAPCYAYIHRPGNYYDLLYW